MFDNLLRKFLEGLMGWAPDFRAYIDDILDDLYPESTRLLDQWEVQFGLPPTVTVEADRITRLVATWAATGGQSPKYVQDLLQANGFNVFVHEWWDSADEVPVGDPSAVPARDPRIVLAYPGSGFTWSFTMGDNVTTMGDETASMGASTGPEGYPLVNKVRISSLAWDYTMGDNVTTMGDETASMGSHSGVQESLKEYVVPDDPNTWPFFMYVGGETYPLSAQVQTNRRDEFEDLLLKLCPAQLWIGVLVVYGEEPQGAILMPDTFLTPITEMGDFNG